jgi:hypothetical protein
MGILAVEILTIWSLVALFTGVAMGAVIQRGDRLRKDEFLTFLFATIANQQASRQSILR